MRQSDHKKDNDNSTSKQNLKPTLKIQSKIVKKKSIFTGTEKDRE